jgi:hypothetical protein
MRVADATPDRPGRPTVQMVLEEPAKDEATGSAEPTRPPVTAHPPVTMEVETPPLAPPRTVEVARGDSLWSLAERELSERFGRAPTDAETSTYWRFVVELNRFRLVDPDDPSRIYAGQRIVLP